MAPWLQIGLLMTSLVGKAGVCLNHSQKGIPQLSNWTECRGAYLVRIWEI